MEENIPNSENNQNNEPGITGQPEIVESVEIAESADNAESASGSADENSRPSMPEEVTEAEKLRTLLEEAEARGAARVRQELANAKASPGSLSGISGESAPVFTREEVMGMSPAQVAEHFDRIRVSMRHWN